MHGYLVGQLVRAKGRFVGRTGKKLYLVVRLLPSPADDVPSYCVRSVPDGVEWITAQDEIELA